MWKLYFWVILVLIALGLGIFETYLKFRLYIEAINWL